MSLSDVKFDYHSVKRRTDSESGLDPSKIYPAPAPEPDHSKSYPKADPGQHYRYVYKGVKLDPARIAQIYGMTDHMEFFILKKVLRMGSAHKDARQELFDIINAAQRRLEMMDEDA